MTLSLNNCGSSLENLQEESDHYLVIQSTSEEHLADHFVLSPQVMRWNHHTIIFALREVILYWNHQARNFSLSTKTLLQMILSKYWGKNWRAILCAHPFQGIFYLSAQRNSSESLFSLQSIISLSALFQRRPYQQCSLDHWFSLLPELSLHWSTNSEHFHATKFKKDSAKFQRFCQRMNIRLATQLSSVSQSSFQKRFGLNLSLAWSWISLIKEPSVNIFSWASENQLNDFPWQALALPSLLEKKRHLDFPLIDWESIEFLLREDLLSLYQNQSPHWRVSELIWSVTLENFDVLDIPIRFRTPYSLHSDAPRFETALFQFFYGFDHACENLKKTIIDDLLDRSVSIIGWSLVIAKQFEHVLETLNIFEQEKNHILQDDLFELENKLPHSFERYANFLSFIPENSFSPKFSQYENESLFPAQWNLSGQKRPLHYFAEPYSLSIRESDRLIFLEKTSICWWKKENQALFERDYFILETKRKQRLWVYRENDEWFCQGVY